MLARKACLQPWQRASVLLPLPSLGQRSAHPWAVTHRASNTPAPTRAAAARLQGGSIASLLAKFGPLDERVIRIYTRQLLTGATAAAPSAAATASLPPPS